MAVQSLVRALGGRAMFQRLIPKTGHSFHFLRLTRIWQAYRGIGFVTLCLIIALPVPMEPQLATPMLLIMAEFDRTSASKGIKEIIQYTG